MFATRMARLLAVLALATLTVSLLLGDEDRGKSKSKPKAPAPSGEVTVDLSKLPRDLARELVRALARTEKSGDKKGKEMGPAGRSIDLTRAIAIAEKAARGTATRAERKGKDEVYFQVEVSTDGGKARVRIDASGKVQEVKGPDKKITRPSEDEGKKKAPGEVVTLDLSKLPPDLARSVRQALQGDKGKEKRKRDRD